MMGEIISNGQEEYSDEYSEIKNAALGIKEAVSDFSKRSTWLSWAMIVLSLANLLVVLLRIFEVI
ncbi:MAG: hypothetical protein KAW14_01865 [Candidatus Aegiribacteria sp.]|nr:hypothetical protein [Candidatus Aegiribacteria sp.]